MYINSTEKEFLIVGKAIAKWEEETGVKAGYRAFIVRCAQLYLDGKVKI